MVDWCKRIWGPNRDDAQRLLVLDQARIHTAAITRDATLQRDTDLVLLLNLTLPTSRCVMECSIQTSHAKMNGVNGEEETSAHRPAT